MMLLAPTVVLIATGACLVPNASAHRFLPALIGSVSATPATITASATDPDLGSVSATPVTVSWSALLGLPTQTWTLYVQASGTSFAGCSTVPVSAVTVTCTAASASGIGGTGTCAGPFPLSTSPQLVASGAEGTALGNYSVNITYTVAESWKYIAAPSCTLTLTYTATTP